MIFFPKNPIKVEVSLSSRQVGGLKSVIKARRLEIIVDIPDGFDGDDPGRRLGERRRPGSASPPRRMSSKFAGRGRRCHVVT